jgi:hypothetical protein
MRTKTGVVGICFLVFGALVFSSTNTKVAEARSNTSKSVVTSEVQRTELRAAVSDTPSGLAAPLPTTTRGATPAEVITPPPADLNLEDPKLRRMQPREISRSMLEVSAKIVRKHYAKPVGTQIEVEVEGKRVIARIERHFHPEGGAAKPWGFHPGVSLFVRR